MQVLEQVVQLTLEEFWRLLTGRADRQMVAEARRLVRQYEAEAGWRSTLRPACEVAAELDISVDALRKRLRAGTWPGERTARGWLAVPPSSPAAPPSRPCPCTAR